MKNKKNKGWSQLWCFGALCLAIQLFAYGAVSLCLADGMLLGAGQAALLCLGALFLLSDKKGTGLLADSLQEAKKESAHKKRGARQGEKKADDGLTTVLRTTLSGVWYAAAFVCFAFMATLPLQKGLSMLGVGSLNETAVFSSLWERILYCWLLPTVTAELLQRRIVLPCLEGLCEKRWLTALLSGVFYGLFLPSLGNLFARVLMGVLLCLLYLRTRSVLCVFSAALAANGFLFLQSYLQTLGLAGAEAYTLTQTLGIGLTFAAPGMLILYFNEKKAGRSRIKALELLCLFVCALFAFALGMAMWLG